MSNCLARRCYSLSANDQMQLLAHSHLQRFDYQSIRIADIGARHISLSQWIRRFPSCGIKVGFVSVIFCAIAGRWQSNFRLINVSRHLFVWDIFRYSNKFIDLILFGICFATVRNWQQLYIGIGFPSKCDCQSQNYMLTINGRWIICSVLHSTVDRCLPCVKIRFLVAIQSTFAFASFKWNTSFSARVRPCDSFMVIHISMENLNRDDDAPSLLTKSPRICMSIACNFRGNG